MNWRGSEPFVAQGHFRISLGEIEASEGHPSAGASASCFDGYFLFAVIMFYNIILVFFGLFALPPHHPVHVRRIVNENFVETGDLNSRVPFCLVVSTSRFLVHGAIDVVPVVICPDSGQSICSGVTRNSNFYIYPRLPF